jgi:hypothetical protein
MDEPTNFLDLDSVDSLIQAANKFKGGLVIVTHNRDFLKKTASTFVSIIPGAFLEFDNIKDAERATYSFITALERGGHVDVKSAIQENRGGGSQMSEEDRVCTCPSSLLPLSFPSLVFALPPNPCLALFPSPSSSPLPGMPSSPRAFF